MPSGYTEHNYSERTPILGDGESACESGIPKRYILTLLSFLGMVNLYTMRVNLSVAIVAMVRKTHSSGIPGSDQNYVACSELIHKDYWTVNTTSHNEPYWVQGEFDWDSSTQATILGSFFYGYVITQLPGGILAEKYGAKWLYGCGIFITSILTLLTPLAARWNVWALIVCRVIEGLAEGVTFPSMNALIGRWVPEMERSRLASIIFTGTTCGTVISMALSGILSSSNFLGGWPSVFYVFGVLAFTWCIFWAVFVYETPESHPHITKQELLYIRRGLKAKKMNVPIPWKYILKSPHVWALVITHFGQNWGFYTLLTELPNYLSNILHFNLKKNGTLSAFPYLMQACFSVGASFLADRLRASNLLKVTTIRKIFNSMAFYIPGICVAIVAIVGCDPVIIMVLLSISMGFNGFIHSGFNVTHVDMSPQFAGVLMGLTNCFANLSGFLAPAFVGFAIADGQTLRNWGTVFLTTSCILFASGTIYNCFCTAELQPWDSTPNSNSPPGDNREERPVPSVDIPR